MRTRVIIWVIIIWIILTLINYYFIPYFILALEWMLLSLLLLIWTILQLIYTFRERKNLSKKRLISLFAISSIFILTLYGKPVNRIIENVDWHIFYSKRCEIIDLVKQGKIAPTASKNYGLCKLPFKFPVLSNGGNEILISKNDSTGKLTVTFWVFRNFFSSPSTHFVYSEDPKEIEELKDIINKHPKDNWILSNNWFRTYRE